MQALKVLVADANDASRATISGALQGEPGVEVVEEARGGIEAITFTHYLCPHVVFIDRNLGGLGGVEVAKYIKRFYPSTKVVFVTGRDGEAGRSFEEKIGADAFIRANNLREEVHGIISGLRGMGPA